MQRMEKEDYPDKIKRLINKYEKKEIDIPKDSDLDKEIINNLSGLDLERY